MFNARLFVAAMLTLGCRGPTGSSAPDPLSLAADPDAFEEVALTIRASETVSATPDGPNLLASGVAPEETTFLGHLIERREGWVRLAVADGRVRVAVWVPEQQVELAPADTLGYATITLSPSWSDASWVELERGTRIADDQTGEVFGVMLQDGPLRWCGGEPQDGSIEVCVPTSWGELRGSVACPCDARRGAGG